MDLRFIDLFCGVGGFRIGLESVGGKCVFSSDIDENCRKTYFANFGDYPKGDIQEIHETDIPDHEILCAGFPCQPFSISGRQKGFEDTRGTLFFEIIRIVREKKPAVVFLENVKHLYYHDSGNTLKVILHCLEEEGYSVSCKICNATDYGLPQNRERIILIGSRNGKKFDFESVEKVRAKALKYFLEDKGDFEYLKPDEYVLLENATRQKSGLIFSGYRKKNIRQKGAVKENLHHSRTHRQPNRIYSVEGYHPTLTSQETSGRFFILLPDNAVRKMTLKECWRIMGFPEDFKNPCSKTVQYKQLGNSVCVPMIASIGDAIKKQLF